MTNLALVAADTVHVVESFEQMTLPAGEAIEAGAPVRIDATTGKFVNGNATTAAEAAIYGIALHSVAANEALTALRHGVLDGFEISALSYGVPIYLSDTDATLADSIGTVPVLAGMVIPGTATTLGTAYDRLLLVDFGGYGGSVPAAYTPVNGDVAITSELLAASVDKWMFVADRAYRVVGFREIHSVVGGSGAVVRPRKVTAAGTDAPGAAAGATVKELTTADIDLTTTINVTQTPTLTATAADALLAAGDKVGLNFGGTLTGLVGLLTMFLRPV